MDGAFLHDAKLPAEILIGMYVALHLFIPSGRAYWIANVKAWFEGLGWLIPTLGSLRRDCVKQIRRNNGRLASWLLRETAWIALEFERGRLERRAELIREEASASFLMRLSDFHIYEPIGTQSYSANCEQAA